MKNFFSSTIGGILSASTTYYYTLGVGWGVGNTTELWATTKYRFNAVLSGLSLYCSVAQTGTTTVTVRQNAVDTSVVISITANTTGTFSDNTHTLNIVAGDDIVVKTVAGSGSAQVIRNLWGLFTHETSSIEVQYYRSGTFGTASVTRYLAVGSIMTASSTESQAQRRARTPVRMRNLFVYISSNLRTNATTIRTRKNTANGNMSVSVPATTTGVFEDTVNSDGLAVSDLYNFAHTTGTGTQAIGIRQLSVMFESVDRRMQHSNWGDTSTLAFNQTRYYSLVGSNDNGGQNTEALVKAAIPFNAKLSNIGIRVQTNTMDGAATLRTRINGANGNCAASITALTTGYFEDTTNSDTVATGDIVNYSLAGSGTVGSIVPPLMGVVIEDRDTPVNKFFPFIAA